MAQSKTKEVVSPSAPSALCPGFCTSLNSVCAVCAQNERGVRRRRTRSSLETLLPPFADAAIAALSRCRSLTPRETEVLILVCSGAKNNVIASSLGISVSAIRRHLRHLHEKTNTSDKAELILNLWYSCQIRLRRRVSG